MVSLSGTGVAAPGVHTGNTSKAAATRAKADKKGKKPKPKKDYSNKYVTKAAPAAAVATAAPADVPKQTLVLPDSCVNVEITEELAKAATQQVRTFWFRSLFSSM
jgi:hypothetical protein